MSFTSGPKLPRGTLKKLTLSQSFAEVKENKREKMAERVGFEPTVGVNLHTLSKRAP